MLRTLIFENILLFSRGVVPVFILTILVVHGRSSRERRPPTRQCLLETW